MGWHDQMGFLRDHQLLLQVVPVIGQRFGFFLKEKRIDNHPVANYVCLPTLEYARGDGAEYVSLSAKLKRMSCVGSPLEPRYRIVLRRQYVDHFAFAFVAPLEA